MANSRHKEGKNYRRGLILGFTIAEIILLVLFALLMALSSQLISGRSAVSEANALKARFFDAVDALYRDDAVAFKKLLNESISKEVQYQKELEAIQKKLSKQSLPDDVYAEIVDSKIDLNTKEGKQRFIDLLSTALKAEKSASKSGSTTDAEIAASCRAGSELNSLLDGKKPADLMNALSDSRAQTEHYKSEAAKCGLGGVLPACYITSGGESTPFLYEARFKPNGIQLTYVLPEKYRTRLSADFPNMPTTGVILSDGEFIKQTNQFKTVGDRLSCRFFIAAYDENSIDKERFKASLRLISKNFRYRIMN